MKVEARYLVDGVYIRDQYGRVILPRGCNLGGDSKIPAFSTGNPLEYDVSFVGRPFPESEADEHFARLVSWGFTFLRFVITWEAVEHAGPGIYDEEYLAYLRAILKKAETYGIVVFIDPHQDVWSRWTGGDGAPGWTLEAVGIDLNKITETGAAFTVQSDGSEYIPMSWGMNYLRYANATMWTLFFAGNTFAPGRYIMGVPAQDWLQDHFIDAMNHTARRLKDCNAIVGFGTLNEPHMGFIGLEDLSLHQQVMGSSGAVPTALQAILSASGFTQKVKRVSLAGTVTSKTLETFNPKAVSLFKDGFCCPWLEAGVWGIEDEKPIVKKSDWFSRSPDGREYDFSNDFLKTFQIRFMKTLSKKHAHYLFFVEGVPMASRPVWNPGDALNSKGNPYNMIEAFHWYDGLTLLFKKWRPWFTVDSETRSVSLGFNSVKKSIRAQISRFSAKPRAEGIPAFLGEFGVPFDLDGGRAFRTDDWSAQEEALGVYYDAIDAALLPNTIWNYSASNTYEQGDGWNTEDLSVFSASSGAGRAIKGFCRPYVMAVAGIPVNMKFERNKRIFSFEWDAIPGEGEGGQTEVFVPSIWYEDGWRAEFSGGSAEIEEKPESQRLYITVSKAIRAKVTVRPLGKGD